MLSYTICLALGKEYKEVEKSTGLFSQELLKELFLQGGSQTLYVVVLTLDPLHRPMGAFFSFHTLNCSTTLTQKKVQHEVLNWLLTGGQDQ